MAELSDFPGFDPESVELWSGHRIGVLPPVADSLRPGEIYCEVSIDGSAHIWVGTARPANIPGNMVLVASSASTGFEQPPIRPPGAPVVIDNPAVTVNGNVVAEAPSGSTLLCTNGNWDYTPDTYNYRWLANLADIGTNQNTYVAQDSDIGNAIECRVTAVNVNGEGVAGSNAVTITATASRAKKEDDDGEDHHRRHRR